MTPPEAAASSNPDGDSGVSDDLDARARRSSATAASLAVTGSATCAGVPASVDQLDERHDRLVVGQHAAGAVDQGQPLPAGVDHGAEVGARPAHGVGDPGFAGDAVDRDHARRLRVRVDAEHVGTDLGRAGWA